MMNDYNSIFINHLFAKRKRRKVNHADDIHKVYTNKYKKWIIDYLKDNNYEQAPILIACNTIYKLPDYFRIQKDSFFLGDYALYNYFFDWNYCMGTICNEDIKILLCIKQYIESLYLKKYIDECYLLCLCTSNIEQYKDEQYYKDDTLIYYDRLTNIQEAFVLLHEATHYLIDIGCCSNELIEQANIYDKFYKIHKKNNIITEKSPQKNDQLFVECVCDNRAVKFLIKNNEFNKDIGERECIQQIFFAMYYLYILQFIDMTVSTNIVDKEDFFDSTLWEITYRIGNIYVTLFEMQQDNELKIDVSSLNNIYEGFIETLKNETKSIRKIIKYIDMFMKENNDLMNKIHNTEISDKLSYIKNYLALI